jgi:hypothetical protein
VDRRRKEPTVAGDASLHSGLSREELSSLLSCVARGRATILGLGNPLRGDDSAGHTIARLLRRAGLPAFPCGSAPENYLSLITHFHPNVVLLIDAADFHAPPGTIRLFTILPAGRVAGLPALPDSPASDHPSAVSSGLNCGFALPQSVSSHSPGLGPLTEYLRLSGVEHISLLAIQTESTPMGARPSPAVRDAIRRIVTSPVWRSRGSARDRAGEQERVEQ